MPTDKTRLDQLEQAVSLLLKNAEASASADPETPSDSTWTCDSCGSLLGVYDPAEDVLRRKYKDDVSFTTLGEGGHITVICRKCACPCSVTKAQLEGLKEDLIRSIPGKG